MDVTFSTFLGQIVSNPVLAVTVILALGAIFVNGWTDAPNAIATCVTTRCMPARAAILMSAAFNFLGVLIMTHFNASVANTISHIVDFGGNSTMALACLCAALFSIVVYGATASRFGIPTSQSHSLIAGLTRLGNSLRKRVRVDLAGLGQLIALHEHLVKALVIDVDAIHIHIGAKGNGQRQNTQSGVLRRRHIACGIGNNADGHSESFLAQVPRREF